MKSSDSKRILPQIQTEGPIFKRWQRLIHHPDFYCQGLDIRISETQLTAVYPRRNIFRHPYLYPNRTHSTSFHIIGHFKVENIRHQRRIKQGPVRPVTACTPFVFIQFIRHHITNEVKRNILFPDLLTAGNNQIGYLGFYLCRLLRPYDCL